MKKKNDMTRHIDTCGDCAAFRVCLARDPEKTAHDTACNNFTMDYDRRREGRTVVDLTERDPDMYGRRQYRADTEHRERLRFIYDTSRRIK